MSAAARRNVRRRQDEWLNAIERSGPFLTGPVLHRVWPAGLDSVPQETLEIFRPTYSAWHEDQAGRQRSWINVVLNEVLGWKEGLVQGPELPAGLEVAVPEHAAVVRADFGFRDPDGTMRLLGTVLPPATRPAARSVGGWSASPADRLAILLRMHSVPLGLATDGRWWALVWAPLDGATSVTVWDAELWLEERETLTAFRCLLERRRFLGVADRDRLPDMLVEGLGQQEEITEGLGRQVRRAVEMLVEAIGRAGRRGGPSEELIGGIDADEIYRGAVTVMMRLLFLFFAEERLLLPADDELYRESYSAGQLVDDLRGEANLVGEEALELRTAGWQRLLSLFRGVHGGIAHDRLLLRAYGGDVFDPERYPWLEGRSGATKALQPVLPIDDRTVLHALEAIQYVTVAGEKRRLSFRTLDVEQIGYVYEGLLGYDAVRADRPVLGLRGRAGDELEVPLSDIEDIGVDEAALAELTALSEKAVAKLLATEHGILREQLLRMACSGDEGLMERTRPFCGLLRDDLRGLPVVVPAGGLYVTVSPRRRLSGTHYTPRDLAEKVVIGALEPLVYNPGPLDTDDRAAWVRRPSAELLGLKVADIAMGSGAFLVSACRYLAGELIEAWAAEADPRVENRRDPALAEAEEADPLVIEARRAIIEHCLYGGDINPMAVEMAKLSLWLVSLSRDLPFSFLDDRLVCGDSLLGLTSLEQLRTLSLDPAKARREAGEAGFDLWGRVHGALDRVEAKRRQVAESPLRDVRDALAKGRLLGESASDVLPLTGVADAMVGAAIGQSDPSKVIYSARRLLRDERIEIAGPELQEVAAGAAYDLDSDRPGGAFPRHPTHWPLAFPEVFRRGGFDAVIGNPPFLGGKKISGLLGGAYREYLVEYLAGGTRGNADLVAYFLLQARQVLNGNGQLGLIATNTITQGDTREVGLDQLTLGGVSIRGAVKSSKWPTRTVNLEYSVIWGSVAPIAAGVSRRVGNETYAFITSALDGVDLDRGKPDRLVSNKSHAFLGSMVLGLGFVLDASEARQLIEADDRNHKVLAPFVNGEDLNQSISCEASRWIINFRDWTLNEASEYPECLQIVTERVRPEREVLRGKNPSGDGYASRWWQFGRRADQLYLAIAHMPRVLAIALTSKVVMPVRVPTGVVFSHAVGVFAYDDGAHLALLSSAFHYWWAITYASTMRTDLRYTPSDVFETLAQPEMTDRMQAAGDRLDGFRRDLMLGRELGLTKLYNLLHDIRIKDADIVQLREIHIEIDRAVAEAYGWSDIHLDHGFHATAQGARFTISSDARRKVLRRLLELNHHRHGEEVASGVARESGRQLDLIGT